MKLFIASDIHGSAFFAKKMISAFQKENCDKILLLGDILYHGPRNNLPNEYNPKEVIELLNNYASIITSVRGNCDGEVDQMVLNFPILSDYSAFYCENATIFATHGHVYGLENVPNLRAGDVLLCGHTHVSGVKELENGVIYINPGSVSIPKENTQNGYAIFENGKFTLKSFDGEIIDEYFLDKTV